jgi:hypothetical protein
MPNRHKKAGSFREHPDELVRRFGHQQLNVKPREPDRRSGSEREDKDVHDMLFERAWRMPH